MRTISFLQPRRLTFGSGSLSDATAYIRELPANRVVLVISRSMLERAEQIRGEIARPGRSVTIETCASGEPSIAQFEEALTRIRAARADCVAGIGGGSVLDLAKLLAAFVDGTQRIQDTFGIGLLAGRNCHLVCIPTTSGTGSEVSPNAILLDEADSLKKGVISPHLVADAAFVDPLLTCSVPPPTTAATGLDTLTHCIEAYTNRFAHPFVDLYALEGIRLVGRFLVRAVRNGNDLEAREAMAQASVYGGLCLGPVNTAAVHALAYPLGGEYHIAHGLSNAILLPSVFRFNAVAAPERHAAVAAALGAAPGSSSRDTAYAGAARLEQLAADCGMERDLTRLGVQRSAIPHLAAAAMTVQRLLRNNPRELTIQNAEAIYAECFAPQA